MRAKILNRRCSFVTDLDFRNFQFRSEGSPPYATAHCMPPQPRL